MRGRSCRRPIVIFVKWNSLTKLQDRETKSGSLVSDLRSSTRRSDLLAGQASFTFSLRSLWDERAVISRVVLVDAEVNLERRADGLRNWRLRDPEYAGPGRVKVVALEAHRTKLQVTNHAIELHFAAAASDPPPDAARAPTLKNRIEFSGAYRKAKFSGVTLAGEVVTLRDSGTSFPVQGHMQWGGTRVEVDGDLTDVLELAAVDAKVRFSGSSLAGLHPILPFRFPETRRYVMDARLKRSGDETSLAGIRAKFGDSDLAGEGSLKRLEPRSLLRAALRSNSADIEDLMARPGVAPGDPGRLFSKEKLGIGRVGAIDAQIGFEAKRLKAGDTLVLENLRLAAGLDDGMLQVKPLDFGLAGGRASVSLTLDARQEPFAGKVTASFRQLSLERLFPATAAKTHASGLVDGRLQLAGRGDSVAALLGSASGSADAAMGRGRISNLADAKLALNAGKILGLWLRGDRDIDILCAAAGFDFSNGAGRARVLTLDTEQTRTDGSGSIDLRAEKFALQLSSTPKKPALLALGGGVHVEGTFRHAKFSVIPGKDAVAVSSASCAGRQVALLGASAEAKAR